MSFVLDPPVSKRVKHVDLNGREETEDQDKAALQAALTAAFQAAANPGADAVTDLLHTETHDSAAVTPREVLDKLNAAKGELDVVLDLINLLEAQHYLGVANIARPSNVQLEEQERALQLQQKVCQLQAAD